MNTKERIEAKFTPTELEFPCYMHSNYSGITVLFTYYGVGTVVKVDEWHFYDLGYHGTFRMPEFTVAVPL